ncbi:MAG: HpsJ family protein [Cyanobacteria bacterium J06573_2]
MKEPENFNFIKSELAQLSQAVEAIQEGSFNLKLWIPIFRVVGYCLLILSLFDVIELFIPPNFMNPVWEFRTMGMLVERTPIPLFGFMLVFAGGLDWRGKWESILVKIFSWLTLLIGILYLLLVPIGVMNTIRLNNNNVAQINNIYNQKLSRAEQIEQGVTKATSEQISNTLKRQGKPIEGKNPEEVKNQVLSELTQAKQRLKNQADNNKSSRRMALLKNAVKWILGALIGGVFFITVWRLSGWAR